MSQLIITSYWIARERMDALRPHYVISLMDATSKFSLPLVDTVKDHETVWVHDITSDDIEFDEPYVVPSDEHVRCIINLAHRWGSSDRVLVHCMAGVSRSAAAGLTYLATLNPGKIEQAARWLRSEGPWLNPNPLMIQLGDQELGLEGRLIDAYRKMGEASMKGVVTPVVLPLRI